MANTPNYGWETPDDTDYVYQGAAAARTTANSIDSTLFTQISNTGYGALSAVRDGGTLFLTTNTETLWFTSGSFTVTANRLYEITYSVGNLSKTTNNGVIYLRLKKNNVAGTFIDGALYNPVTSGDGFPFSKTIVLSSAQLGLGSFSPAITLQSSNNGVYGENGGIALGYGYILVKDIGTS
jgi:hypothetical protein